MEQEYFTIPEVAEKLKVTPAGVRKWIAQGKIEVVYVGSDRRITGAAIEAFVRESTQARQAKRAESRGGKDSAKIETDTRMPALATA